MTLSAPVLIVDDEADIRSLLARVLAKYGMAALVAENAAEARAILAKQSVSIVLMDVMMPGLDGWQVAERLLADPVTGSLPIVFLTARAELRDHARGLGIGGVDYVTKPFDPLGLAGVIRELVARVASGESLELRRTKLAELRSLVEGA